MAGKLLGKRLKTALLGFTVHDRLFNQFSDGIDDHHKQSWTTQIVAYERDPSLPDPYHVESVGMSSTSVY